MKNNFVTKAAAALAAGALIAIGAPLAASAHVSITPGSAEPGSYTVVTVKVPSESETATTTKLELTLPSDTPFSSVRYVPVAGWTTELVTTTLPEPVTVGESEITEAVTKVIWTAAAGSEIMNGQLQQFALSLGPVPDTGSVMFIADQYYSDGTIVSWSEPTVEGEEEPSKPAPVLYINDAAPSDHHAGGAAEDEAAHADDEDMTMTAATTATGDDIVARVLGIAGLVLGAVGIVFGITARRQAAK